MRRIGALIACFNLFLGSLCATFPQIYSLDEIKEDLLAVDEKALVVFDVDEVLIITKDGFTHPSHHELLSELKKEWKQKISSLEQKKQMEDKMSLVWTLPKRVLIEENSPFFIQDLQSRGLKVIALTALRPGPFGLFPKFEKWRIDHLCSLDIHFQLSFPELDSFHFTDLVQEKKETAPLFEEGFLFSGDHPKGEVLKAFITWSQFTPSKVIFIDDLEHNLKNVESVLGSLDIPVSLYQYRGGDRFFKSLNPKRVRYQAEHLLETDIWLSDEEVDLILEEF